jgi:hypothetical protein
MLSVFSLCVVIKLSVAPTCSSPGILPVSTRPPNHAVHAPPPTEIISWSVVCRGGGVVRRGELCGLAPSNGKFQKANHIDVLNGERVAYCT